MTNKLVNYSIDSRSIQEEDDDWETDSDFVNTNNLDNSKKTVPQQQQGSPVNYRASVIGRDFMVKQQPIDKVPTGPIGKKPAATPSSAATPKPPISTGGSSIKSVTSKFSQVSVSEPTPVSKPPVSKPPVSKPVVKATPPPVSTPTPVSKPVVKATPTPVQKAVPVKQPEVVKATPPPVPVATKKPPPPPKRIVEPEPEPEPEQYYDNNDQGYDNNQYDQSYDNNQYDQSYDNTQNDQNYDQSYDNTQYDEQSYDNTQNDQNYDQSYDNTQYDDQSQQQYDYPQAEALYDYVGEQEGDLTFYKGDILYIYDTSDEGGWWSGSVVNGDGSQGIFPSTYVSMK